MPDSALDLLKLVLLVLLYLFFARVLWAVWSEVRQPQPRRAGDYLPATPINAPGPAPTPTPTSAPTPSAGPHPEPRPGRRQAKAAARQLGRGAPTKLVVLEPDERRGTVYSIGGGVSIGRDPSNAVHLGDSYLSSHHAKIAIEADRVVIADLASRNGTYLNGARLNEPRTLLDGDRIQIGYTIFEAQR